MKKRPRGRRNPSGFVDVTLDTRYFRIRTTGWFMRLLDKRVSLNSSLYDAILASLGLASMPEVLEADLMGIRWLTPGACGSFAVFLWFIRLKRTWLRESPEF